MKGPSWTSTDGRFATLLDAAGNPPCSPPDGCQVCVLFADRQPGESRDAWLARLADLTREQTGTRRMAS